MIFWGAKIVTLLLFAALTSAHPAIAVAQEQESAPKAATPALDEIIVSASRRDESLQDVPVAVSAFGAEAIADREMTSVADLQMQTPGLTYAQVLGMGQITMRGVGSDLYTLNAEPGVAIYLNDIYLARSFLSEAAMLQLERVEVLRGPQGTLYGRNTSGGAIKYVTKRPTNEVEAKAAIQYGAYEQYVGEVGISGPIIEDVLTARFGAYREEIEGWTENLYNGHMVDGSSILSLSGAMDLVANDWLTITLDADYQKERNSRPVAHGLTPLVSTAVSDSAALPVLQPYDVTIRAIEQETGFALDPLRAALTDQIGGHSTDDPRAIYANIDPYSALDTKGIAVTSGIELGFATLKLIGGWRHHELLQRYDADGSDLTIIEFDPRTADATQISLEIQMQSPGENDLRWIVGIYGFDEDATETYDISQLVLDRAELDQLGVILPPDFPYFQGGAAGQIDIDSDYDTRSYAAFGDAAWDATDWLTVRLGGRYTYDRKVALVNYYAPDLTNNCSDLHLEQDWRALTGKAGVDVRLDEDRMIYGAVSQGFKSGGFNSTGCDTTPYDPEYVLAYEMGLKSEWWDRRVRLNLAAFYYDFTDIQVQQVDGLLSYITNAAKATVKGVELEANAVPTGWLSFDGTVTFLDATYDEFIDDEALTQFEGDIDLSGNTLPKSPRWATSLGVVLSAETGGYVGNLRGEWIYRSRQYFTQFNNDFNSQPAFQLFNLYLTISRDEGGPAFQAFVKNLTDEAYLEGGLVASAMIGGPVGYYAPPRRWGFELSYKY